jgi:acyl-CoA thioesterase
MFNTLAVSSQFDRDLVLHETDREHTFSGTFHDRWYIDRALHGGHVISAMVRGIEQAVADPQRALRSITIHYVAPAKPGAYEIVNTIDRTGRSLSNVRAQIMQDGKVIASAMAALGTEWPSIEWNSASMPDVPPASECPDMLSGTGGFTNLHRNFTYRRAFGGGIFSGKRLTKSGGWIRLVEPRPLDAALICGLTDTWIPLPFTMFDKPVLFPTIDLTVQLLRSFPIEGNDGTEPCFVWHRSDTSQHGYLIQDTEVWSHDHQLLARARQHALLIPISE